MNVLLGAFPLGLLQCDAKMKAFGPIYQGRSHNDVLRILTWPYTEPKVHTDFNGEIRMLRKWTPMGLDLRCLSVLLAGTLLLLTN